MPPRTIWPSRDVLRVAALVLGVYFAARALWFADQLVLVCFLGVLFGITVTWAVDQLEARGVPRGAGAPLIVFGVIGLLVGLGSRIAPLLERQGAELTKRLPQAVDRIQAWIGQQDGLIAELLGGAALRQRATTQLAGLTRYLFPFLSSTVATATGLLLMVFLSLYIAIDPDTYRGGLFALVPVRLHPRMVVLLARIASVLRRWLVTQLVGMCIIGCAVGIAMTLLGVHPAIALGALAGVFEFIPTIGPVLSAVPAIAMGLLDGPEKALTVVLVFVGIQFLETHLVMPLLMKGSIHLPPALTISFQVLMTLLFGFLGLLTAVPVLATTIVAVRTLYVEGALAAHPGEEALPAGRG